MHPMDLKYLHKNETDREWIKKGVDDTSPGLCSPQHAPQAF